MSDELVVLNDQQIQERIFTVRGMQVMLDSDLAEMYGVETKVLNQAVKRNISRFPENFRFQLTQDEKNSLRSQSVTLKETNRGKHKKYLPYVFTEQGVSMLSAVLKSEIAIQISIQIIDAFVNMRKFISKNAMIFQRLDIIEKKQLITDTKLDKVFDAIEAKEITPEQGIFFDGQIFDAYVFVSDLIKSAKKSIVLIDNYVDESVLTLLSKRYKNCKAIIYTRNISKSLRLDLAKHNKQYQPIEIKTFKNSHDRFLILEEKTIYHIGASLKDLGKKWFAFSKFDSGALDLLGRLK
ncbi:ORF6N domain-containing protein [bacterium]|nr:ORF6N domain-containing protein [bacterium]